MGGKIILAYKHAVHFYAKNIKENWPYSFCIQNLMVLQT